MKEGDVEIKRAKVLINGNHPFEVKINGRTLLLWERDLQDLKTCIERIIYEPNR